MTALALIPPKIEVLEGEVLGADEDVVFFQRSPFVATRAVVIKLPLDATLADYVAALEMPAALRPHCRVYVGETEVARGVWHLSRPKRGHAISVRVFPGKGGAFKNILRTVIMIAIVVTASVLLGPGGAFGAAGLAGALGGGVIGAVGYAIAIAAISFIATLALNAIIPPPRQSSDNRPVPFLTGGSNAFNPYGAIPRVFGKHRVYPVIAAHPYTEINGKDQYLRLLLCVGFGPVKISDIRIGNTPLSAYTGVQYEVSEGGPQGWGGNTTITLYNTQVRETDLNIAMNDVGTATFQTTALATNEISVDIAFPQGLNHYDKDGNKSTRTINFLVEYRTSPSGAWVTPTWLNTQDPGMNSGGIMAMGDSTNSLVVRTGRWKVTSGQYDVRITRQTAKGVITAGGNSDIDACTWVKIRSVVDATPVNQTGVALIAIRIKASDQLQGQVQNINCLAEAYLPVYASGAWSYQITRSPAWAYCDVLRRRGPDNIMLADNRLDLAGFQNWDAACAVAPGNAAGTATWEYNGVIEGGSVFEAAKAIAAIGRAAFAIVDGKYSVVRDLVQSTPVQAFTPRNSWGYAGVRNFVTLPHAVKIRFYNETKDYNQDEIYAYADGYNVGNATLFDTMELIGCTSPKQAWREGRYHLAVGSARQEEHTINVDVEALRCIVGDRVQLVHDAISVGLGWGRIVSNNSNGTVVTQLNLDGPVQFEGGSTYQMRVRHGDSTSSIRAVTPPAGTPSRTNLVRNAIAAGSALGTPGTLPTNWVDSSTGGLTRQVVAVGDDYMDVRYSGTAAGAVTIDLRPDANMAATASTTYTASASFALQAGSLPATPSIKLDEYTGTPSLVGTASTNFTPTSFLTQATVTRAFGATGVQALPRFVVTFGAGTYDFTIRISSWQLEAASSSTGYIQTTGLARTLYDPVSSVTIASEPVATAPAADTVWMFGLSGLESLPCIVRRIEAQQDLSAKLTLVAYDSGILSADSGAIPTFTSYITNTFDTRTQKPSAPFVSVRSDDTVVEITKDGTQNVRIAVDIRPSTSSLVQIANWEVQYKLSSATVWTPAGGSGIAAASMSTVFCTPVTVGLAYDVQVRAISMASIASDWAQVLNTIVVGKTISPMLPTSPTVTAIYLGNTIKWTNPTNPDLAYIEVFASQTNTQGSSVSIGRSTGTSFSIHNLAAFAQWYYWIRAVDTAGNATTYVYAGTGTTLGVDYGNVTGPTAPAPNATYNKVQGAWTTGATYIVGDIVQSSGSSYSCILSNTAASTNAPPNSNYWTLFAQGGVVGSNGTDAVTASISKENVSLQTYANGTVVSFANASGQWSVFKGATDVTSSSTFTSNPVGCTGSVNASGAYSVTAMSAATATMTMTATYNNNGTNVTYTKIFSLTQDVFGYEIVSTLPTTNLFDGRVVYLTTDKKLYRYNGTAAAWQASVASTDITGTLADAQLAALSASKVTGTLSDSQLASIAASKVTGQLSDSQLAAIASTKITGTLTDTQLSAISAAKITGTITTTQITDGAISTAKISAGAVTTNSIAANTIVAGNIAAGAITTATIATGAVTAATIASGTITASQIAASTITGTQIAAATITSGQIAANTIVAGNIAAGAITTATIAAGAVTAATIAANTITSGQIAANTITAGQIAANTITASQIAAGTITANEIAAGTITAAKLSVNSLSSITATIGTLRTASTGARTEISDNLIQVFDSSGTLRIRLGQWP